MNVYFCSQLVSIACNFKLLPLMNKMIHLLNVIDGILDKMMWENGINLKSEFW
jgi:hypothetical protein